MCCSGGFIRIVWADVAVVVNEIGLAYVIECAERDKDDQGTMTPEDDNGSPKFNAVPESRLCLVCARF